jgi:hypothetical protein
MTAFRWLHPDHTPSEPCKTMIAGNGPSPAGPYVVPHYDISRRKIFRVMKACSGTAEETADSLLSLVRRASFSHSQGHFRCSSPVPDGSVVPPKPEPEAVPCSCGAAATLASWHPFRTPAFAMYNRPELPLRWERRLRIRFQWAAVASSAGIASSTPTFFLPVCMTIASFE